VRTLLRDRTDRAPFARSCPGGYGKLFSLATKDPTLMPVLPHVDVGWTPSLGCRRLERWRTRYPHRPHRRLA
jgi:hypothetical protein